jgi:hypothetical protein
MEVENKPNQTDPSAEIVSSATENVTLDDLIKERVAEAMKIHSSVDALKTEPPKVEPKQGGSGSDVSTQKDSSLTTDPNNSEVLTLVGDVLGRKFDSVEDVKKTLTNLNSLVGDNSVAKAREASQLYDKFTEKWAQSEGQTVEEARKFWADTLKSDAAIKTVAPVRKSDKPESPVENTRNDKISAEVDTLRTKFERNELLTKYPYASEVQEDIAIIAKNKGISQLDAFEKSSLKPLAEQKANEESKKSPVVTSSNRIGYDKQKVQDLAARVAKNGDERDKINLVKELGLIR